MLGGWCPLDRNVPPCSLPLKVQGQRQVHAGGLGALAHFQKLQVVPYFVSATGLDCA
jgi:hypothetical protein